MLQNCLERLLAESTTARTTDLTLSLQEYLENLEIHKKTKIDSEPTASSENLIEDVEKIAADRYWEPFQLALHPSKPVRIREVALDCIQKLIAHHRLKGAIPGNLEDVPHLSQGQLSNLLGRKFSLSSLLTPAPVTTGPNTSPLSPMSPLLLDKDPSFGESVLKHTFLIDQIIHTIGNSFILSKNPASSSETSVQLQVLKVFLTAVTSGDCEIHETSLVKLFETCFAIHVTSPKGSTNEVTSKAILTQMVNVIFSKMERFAELHAVSLVESSVGDSNTFVNPEVNTTADSLESVPKENAITINSASSAEESVLATKQLSPDKTMVPSLPDDDNDEPQDEEEDKDESPSKSPAPELTKHVSLASEYNLSSSEISLSPETHTGTTKAHADTEKTASPSLLISGFSVATDASPEQEQDGVYTPPDFAINNPYKATPEFYYKLLQRDVFLVFRFLCFMSVFSDSETKSAAAAAAPGHTTPTDDISTASVKARSLALELILSVLNNAGPILRSNPTLVVVVREKLCMAISKNALTTDPTLFELSLSIFLLIIRHYRDKLKVEVEVLLNTIFLHILEMGNSTYKQKSIVLQGLIKICENPQTLVDLYVNYDCDMSMTSVFERLSNICAKITQKRADSGSSGSSFGLVGYAVGLDSKNELLKEQDRRLKMRGLVALVAIIQSLVAWSQDDWIGSAVKNGASKETASVKSLDQTSPVRVGQSRPESVMDDRERSEAASRNELASFDEGPVLVVNKNHLNAVTMSAKNSDRSRAVSTSPAPGADLDADDIQSVVSRKQQLKKGIRLFNRKPNKGMKELIANKLVDLTPEGVAEFLQNTSELSKSSIGEYLGDGDQFNIKVMHAFIDAMDFSGMGFVDALRAFLQAFRLPGEAQKIDRIMEKFADRFCENNPDVFAKADTAYTLAFSVIMLNTDQHSSQIKHRMDKAAFIKNNRGINDDGDLPDEFLSGIFDDIAGNEIIMEEEHAGKLAEITKGWGAGDLNDRQRMEFYRKEVSMIQKKSQMLMAAGQANRDVAPFRTAAGSELARPMFAMVAWPLMATLSLFFEAAADDGDDDPTSAPNESNKKHSSDPHVADLCLKGFAGAIRLASIFRMETERDAFVTSLAKLTGLGNIFNMKPKNIKGIKTLVELASSLGEYMETSWLQILKAMSHIERLQMIVSNSDLDTKPSVDKKVTPAMEQYAADLSSQSFVIISDRIFTTTGSLSSQAILHFFRCLCQVSLEEVGMDLKGTLLNVQQGPPRMYGLQKMVEVAHYNVKRIRYEWTQIWRVLQTHFNIVACHPDQRVSTFAVDSLRQLGMKFLEREELGHFTSQHEFLKSFESIIRRTESRQTRELILSSVSQMISAKANSIRSGWRSLFVVLVRAAQTDEKLAKQAFSVVLMIFRKHVDEVVSAAAFVDFVSSLAEFALLKGDGPVHDELVMGAIQLLQSCTKSLVDRGEQEAAKLAASGVSENDKPPRSSQNGSSTNINGSTLSHPPRINNLPSQPYLLSNGRVSEEHFYLSWFPILSAFSRVIIESDGVLVRTHTLETLFETLRSSGGIFEPLYWKGIHRNVLAPIFEDLAEQESQPQGKEASSTILILGLRLLVDMVTAHFDDLIAVGSEGTDPYAVEFLQSSLDMMVTMMGKKDEKLPLSGQLCLNQFLLRNVEKLAKLNSWEWLVDKIYNAFSITSPLELLNCDVLPNKSTSFVQMNETPTLSQQPSSVGMSSLSETKESAPTDSEGRPSVSGLPPPPITTTRLESRTSEAEMNNPRASSASMDRRLSVPQVIPIQNILGFARCLALDAGPAITLDQLDFDHTVMKCATHLELIRTIRQFCLTPIINDNGSQVPVIVVISNADRCKILHCLYNSYTIARGFNSLNDLRRAIKNKGWISRQPNLFKQEALSFASYIALLFAAYKAYGDVLPSEPMFDKAIGGIPQVLIQESIDLLDRFTEFLSDIAAHSREIEMWYPVVILIYRELLSIQSWWSSPESAIEENESPHLADMGGLVRDQSHPDMTHLLLRRELPRFFRRAIRLMNIPRQDVRNVLQEFMERVGSDIFKAGE